MAQANRKLAAVAVDLPECPVCLETMTSPIFQCQSGHSLCNPCYVQLCPMICPICRQPMTQIRNRQLEEIVEKAKVACPNKSLGCVYTMTQADVDEHLNECIFRIMDCPLGAVLGKCSWNGKLKEMMDHFKERHPTHCNIDSDKEVDIDNVSIKDDDRHVFLVAQGKMVFILTMKIDTLQKMAYWTVQHIASKKAAERNIYEIHVTSKLDPRRKAVFIEHCNSDSIKADDVFRTFKCAMLPLDMLNHFIKDKKLSFRFFIKRSNPIVKNKDKNNSGNDENKPANKGPKGPGPKGPGPKGPGPKGSGPNGPPPKNFGPKPPGPKGPKKAQA